MPDLKALADLLERHDKAMTPGEWRPAPSQQYENDSITYIGGLGRVVGTSSADQAGIAALRNALPSIVAALRRAEGVEKALNDHLRECEDCRVYDPASGAYGRRGRECQRCALIRAALKEPTDA